MATTSFAERSLTVTDDELRRIGQPGGRSRPSSPAGCADPGGTRTGGPWRKLLVRKRPDASQGSVGRRARDLHARERPLGAGPGAHLPRLDRAEERDRPRPRDIALSQRDRITASVSRRDSPPRRARSSRRTRAPRSDRLLPPDRCQEPQEALPLGVLGGRLPGRVVAVARVAALDHLFTEPRQHEQRQL
jgi:hypothetical protein